MPKVSNLSAAAPDVILQIVSLMDTLRVEIISNLSAPSFPFPCIAAWLLALVLSLSVLFHIE